MKNTILFNYLKPHSEDKIIKTVEKTVAKNNF